MSVPDLLQSFLLTGISLFKLWYKIALETLYICVHCHERFLERHFYFRALRRGLCGFLHESKFCVYVLVGNPAEFRNMSAGRLSCVLEELNAGVSQSVSEATLAFLNSLID